MYFKLVDVKGGNGLPYKDIVLKSVNSNDIVKFKTVNDLKLQKDKYIGLNYYFDKGGKFRPFTDNPLIKNKNNTLDDIVVSLRDISKKLSSTIDTKLISTKDLLRVEKEISNLNLRLTSIELKLDNNFVSMQDRFNMVQQKVDTLGISLETYEKNLDEKIRGLYDITTDFDGNYKFPRCKNVEFFDEIYTKNSLDKDKNDTLNILYEYCVRLDKAFDSIWSTLQRDFSKHTDNLYDFYNVVNSDSRSVAMMYGVNMVKNQCIPHVPLLKNFFSRDYKSKMNSEDIFRPKGLYSDEARDKIKSITKKKNNNDYIMLVTDLMLFLSNISCFLVEGTEIEKSVVRGENRYYTQFLKNTACHPVYFEDKMLIDFFCKSYLYWLNLSMNKLQEQYNYRITQTGLDALFILFRHMVVAYFAAKKVFVIKTKINSIELNNFLNLTYESCNNKELLNSFLSYVKYALLLQGLNEVKSEEMIEEFKNSEIY